MNSFFIAWLCEFNFVPLNFTLFESTHQSVVVRLVLGLDDFPASVMAGDGDFVFHRAVIYDDAKLRNFLLYIINYDLRKYMLVAPQVVMVC